MKLLKLGMAKRMRFPAGRAGIAFFTKDRLSTEFPFRVGKVWLFPNGGQVPWHNHPGVPEIYHILEGQNVEIALGDEVLILRAGDVVEIPPGIYHQLTNRGRKTAVFQYVFSGTTVAHWSQELTGTLPRAGIAGVPALPAGAYRQCPLSTGEQTMPQRYVTMARKLGLTQ